MWFSPTPRIRSLARALRWVNKESRRLARCNARAWIYWDSYKNGCQIRRQLFEKALQVVSPPQCYKTSRHNSRVNASVHGVRIYCRPSLQSRTHEHSDHIQNILGAESETESAQKICNMAEHLIEPWYCYFHIRGRYILDLLHLLALIFLPLNHLCARIFWI